MRGAIAAVVAASLFVVGCARPEISEEQSNRYEEAKQVALERLLGPMHNVVGHAIVPFGVTGGAVDMYYFPNGIPGTGFATMELIQPDGSGPRPNRIGTYELVTFTKQTMPSSDGESDKNHPFNEIERRMCRIMTGIGLYSREAVLNPGETCEFPADAGEAGICLIFDEYHKGNVGLEIDGRKHCLLLCMEIFPSEMRYAMQHGSAVVFQKLKEAGHYPYSDLNRTPVF